MKKSIKKPGDGQIICLLDLALIIVLVLLIAAVATRLVADSGLIH
jgi:hypothetical protein